MKQGDKPCIGCSVHCFVKNCQGGMNRTMKLGTTSKGVLSKANEDRLLSDDRHIIGDTSYYELLQLVAQMFDNIADGEDMYMILGATSNKTSFVLTVKHNGTPTSIYAQSLVELGLASKDLL